MTPPVKIRLGTRASALAQVQANDVKNRLEHLGVDVSLVLITTQGDQQQQNPLGEIGGQGLFTKRIQQALIDGEIDLAVHSLKDLPTDPVSQLCLTAIPPRERVADVLISRTGAELAQLPAGARIGTGSLRRRSQLLACRHDLEVVDIRGNVDTRLNKLEEGLFDAIILAEAGLRRLGMQDRITEVISKQILLPAVGQGALGLETRVEDEEVRRAVAPLDDPASHAAILAERALLRNLRGGCLAPVGAWASITDDQLQLEAVVLNASGTKRLDVRLNGPMETAQQLGEQGARQLLAQGAADLIASARSG